MRLNSCTLSCELPSVLSPVLLLALARFEWFVCEFRQCGCNVLWHVAGFLWPSTERWSSLELCRLLCAWQLLCFLFLPIHMAHEFQQHAFFSFFPLPSPRLPLSPLFAMPHPTPRPSPSGREVETGWTHFKAALMSYILNALCSAPEISLFSGREQGVALMMEGLVRVQSWILPAAFTQLSFIGMQGWCWVFI